MKIKTKKQLNLPQLIEWGFENSVTGNIYSDNRVEAKKITFEVGVVTSMYGDIHKDDTFSVEVEEEITEDTVIQTLVTRNTIDSYYEWKNHSVNNFNLENIKAIYIPNDDYTMTLIWTHDKGLVE